MIPVLRAHRRLALLAAGSLLSVVAAWLAIRDVSLAQTFGLVVAIDVRWLVVAFTALGLQVSIRSLRWSTLLPANAHGRRIPVRRVLPVTLIGYLGNAVLPARLGEPLRAALIAAREGIAVSETLGSVVLERALDTLALAGLGVVFALLLAAPDWVLSVAIIGALVSSSALVAIVAAAFTTRGRSADVLPRQVARLARQVHRVLHGARIAERPVVIGATIGLSLGAWALDAALFWFAARSIGVELSPADAVLVSVVAVLSTVVPSAPGYVGTFHLAAAAAAGALGVPPAPALAMAVVAHSLTVVPLALGGAASAVALGIDGTVRAGRAPTAMGGAPQ